MEWTARGRGMPDACNKNQRMLSFPNTGGMSVSPHTLSFAALRSDALRDGNSETHIEFNLIVY
jgi:hypothetical protein